MSLFNNVTIVGNVTRDSESRKFSKKDGKEGSVTRFSIANNRKYGETESTVFLDVEYYDKEVSFTKGERVLVEGEIRDGSYQSKDGTQVSKIKIVANGVFPFSSPKKDNAIVKQTAAKSTPKAVEEVADEAPL